METVGVWSGGEALVRRLEAALGAEFQFLWGTHPADFARGLCAGLIIAPDATALAGAGVVRKVQAASAVSYGLGRQNTLTLSSLDGGSVSVCLQRELVTLAGATVERQEWVLPFDRATQTPEEFLCLCGALLALGRGLG